MRGYTALALQKPVLPEEQPLFPGKEERKVPFTVLLPSTHMLHKFKREDILSRARQYPFFETESEADTWWWCYYSSQTGRVRTDVAHSTIRSENMTGLVVPEQIVRVWDIRPGHLLGLSADRSNKELILHNVEGFQDPEKTRNLPNIRNYSPDFPNKPLPIERFGDFDLRVWTLVAPIGEGQRFGIKAGGSVGKSWMMYKAGQALLKLAQGDSDSYVVVACISDHPEEPSVWLDLFYDEAHPHMSREEIERIAEEEGLEYKPDFRFDEGEFYEATENTPTHTQVSKAELIMERTDRLVEIGKNVRVIFDSGSKHIVVHSRSPYVDTQTGWVGRGVYLDSYGVPNTLFGNTGRYHFGTKTLFLTFIESDGEMNKTEGMIANDLMETWVTSKLRLVNIGHMGYPKVSINEADTGTRFPPGRDWRSEKQRTEMREVREILRGISGLKNTFEAAKALKKHAREHPIPPYLRRDT